MFEPWLVNQRVREDDLLLVASGDRASPAQLQLLADDRKWSYRYAIRNAVVMNPSTPRSTAASLLRFLSKGDLRMIHANLKTSVYLRRCIERCRKTPRRRRRSPSEPAGKSLAQASGSRRAAGGPSPPARRSLHAVRRKVEFDQKSFDNSMELKEYLESLFGRPVDPVLEEAIKSRLRESILREAIRAA